MVLHNHVNLNVTYNGEAIRVPEHIGMVEIGKAEDIRDAMRIAKLTESPEDVDWIIDTQMKYAGKRVI
jgi:hypothetical protein